MTEINVNVSDGGKSQRIAAALDATNASMLRQLRTEIEAVAQEKATETQAHLQGMPTTHSEHTGLRERIAAGVKVNNLLNNKKVTGVVINTVVEETAEAPIPLGIETIRGWRHPVFGHADRWVQQTPRFEWFSALMAPAEGELTDRFTGVLDTAAQEIARS